MSEQKLVSPLLDGFQVGDPISCHDGVRCCPAIKENSDNKYIVKILSIPASQSQLDALLLAGAFQDAAGALDYFKDLADGIAQEVKLHQQLARLDGFVPCDAWQIVPMDDNQLGYEVYLLTPYHRTLDRHLKKMPLTHLEAVNLGLDMCAALTASRRAGFLYVDLKPGNVFIASDREFLIGDLGFMRMDSLKYAALPTKYRSAYTAPEMMDDFATISDTADVYALGLMLYQVYNDGQLPDSSGDGPMTAPANADYEMAEIILKACAQEPGDRWQNPSEMGQALVSYMKRNKVNDVPIMPPDLTPAESQEQITEETTGQTVPAEEPAQETEPAEAPPQETVAEEATAEETEEVPAQEEICEESSEESVQEAPAEETAEAQPEADETEESAEEEASVQEDAAAEPVAEETEAEPAVEDTQEASEETGGAEESESGTAEEETEVREEAAEETAPQEESTVAEELAFIEELESDDIDEMPEDSELSEEMTEILAQADELVSHEIPEPVVVTAPQLPEEEPVQEEVLPEAEETEDEEDEEDDEVEIPITIPDLEPIRKKGKKWLITAIILALLAAASYGVSHYYTNYYLVPVESIELRGSCNTIIAQISVPFDEHKITAVCTDTYGNTAISPVVAGQAYFDGLNPGTQYTVTLQVSSFNKFTGNCSATFTTDQQIKLVSISATTGSEDGSVILSFTVDGYDPQNWTVEYGEDQTMDFTGHMVTIPGLTVGETYTFSLRPTEETDVALVGQTALEFTVSPVILARNVAVESFENGTLTIGWTADAEVGSWTVRCTGNGVDETVTVTENRAQFSGIEMNKTYSVEILAEGMTQSSRTELNVTPLSISNVETTMVNDYTLRVTWEYTGEAPAAGWSVGYTIDGQAMESLTTDTNAADLPLVIPGATYDISVGGVDSNASTSVTCKIPAAGKYTENGYSSSGMSYSFCVTPDSSNWTHEDVKKYGSSFKAGQSVSMVVYAKESVDKSDDKIQVLYVVRDADGKVLTKLCKVQTKTWNSLWNDRYFYPTLPLTISEEGSYTFEVYFDGALALKKTFTMS